MSRSYSKHVPLWGSNWKRISEKEDKKEWHKKMRGKFKSQIFNEVEVPNVNKNEVSNKWMMRKDDGPIRIHHSIG